MIKALAGRTLRCHPLAPCRVGIEVTAEVGVDESVFVVTYRIVGDLARLRIPTEPLDPERLWAHTCCELFVAPERVDAYVEHNFSPTGQVARFDFARYRDRVPSPSGASASVSCTRDREALLLHARAPLSFSGLGRIAIATVIEDDQGGLSYWALRHPIERPDFHHPGGFALSLTLGVVPAIVDAP